MTGPVEPLDLDDLTRDRAADVEQLIIDWVRQAFAAMDLHVANELPPGDELTEVLADHTAFVHVEAFGGGDRNVVQENVNVDVDVYVGPDSDGNPNRAAAADIAALLRAGVLFHLPGYYTATATVSAVSTMSRPTARPYDDNSALRRYSAAYTMVIKSHG